MEKICEYCQRPFLAVRSTRKYCSDSCKQLAYYGRNDVETADAGYFLSDDADEETINEEGIVKEDTVKIDTVKMEGAAMSAGQPELSEATVNAIAERVVELIGERLFGGANRAIRQPVTQRHKSFTVN